MRLLAIVVIVAACRGDGPDAPELGPPPPAPIAPVQARAKVANSNANAINPRLLRRFKPIESLVTGTTAADRMRVHLGKQLFFDKRLSLHRDTACATCHPLDRGGMDQRATSRGDRGRRGTRNAPTVYNAAWHVAQLWDGRAHTSEDQAKLPILNPDEMAMRSPHAVTQVLRAIAGYADEFAVAFPDEGAAVDFEHAVTAIAAFERTLMTPSRWDLYLRGDTAALSAAELEGLKLFADVGCVQCHTGELLGGSMFQRVGVAHPWPDQDDQGRFAITHDASDRMVFKVPSLRNVAVTGPYFHDGRTSALPEAVRMMANFQLDTELTPAEVGSIVTWLATLTGVLSPDALAPPELPPG